MKEFLAKKYISRILKYGLYMLVVLIFQTMLLSGLRPLGVCPLFLPAAVVAVGMFEGATWGAVFGLIIGIFADMAFVESTVAFTLLFPVISFAVGFVSQFFLNKRFLPYMGVALVGLLVTALAQMLRVLVRDGLSADMLETALLQALWALPFAALAYIPPARMAE